MRLLVKTALLRRRITATLPVWIILLLLTTVTAQEWPSGSKTADRLVKSYDGVEYAFRWIPPGRFVLHGKPAAISEQKKPSKVDVTFTCGVWMLETEVTQNMWTHIIGSDPAYYKGADRPVESVSWKQAQEFCQKASQQWGVKVSLPTSALWEYACLAGQTPKDDPSSKNGRQAGRRGNPDENLPSNDEGRRFYANNVQAGVLSSAWGAAISKGETHDAGTSLPNQWGLYDMLGNVWEMCSDYYGELPLRSVSDPTGPRRGFSRVLRGGSYSNYLSLLTPFHRTDISPEQRRRDVGFRFIAIPNRAEPENP